MASVYKVESTGKWRARVRRPGAAKQSKNFLTKADAEAWARGVERDIERGLWHPNGEAETTTLGTAVDRYALGLHIRYLDKLDNAYVFDVPRSGKSAERVTPAVRRLEGKKVGNVPRTEVLKALSTAPILGVSVLGKPREASILRQLKADTLARRALASIHEADIATLRDRWLAADLKAGSVLRRMHTLSHVFTIARKEWHMPALVNPVSGVTLPDEDDARDRRVSSDELDAIIAAGEETRHLSDLVRLAVETACRREELVYLRWADVDLKARTARLRKTKNGQPRTVPLTREAAALLAALPRAGDRVLVGWTGPDSATQAFGRAAARARRKYTAECKKQRRRPNDKFLVDVRMHDLRHEAISRLAARKIEIHQLAKITGHLTLRMLMRYYNPTDEELVALVDKG